MLQKTRLILRNAAISLICAASFAGTIAAQEQSFADIQQAALEGDAGAQLALARIFDAGAQVPQDFAQAVQWYRKAAEGGNIDAQNQLGRALRAGLGGAPNLQESVVWLTRAAEAGNPAHIYDLAQMFEQGAGVAQDYARAADLYAQAAKLGHEDSAVSLGVLYQNGTGVAQDYAKAHDLYLPGAEAGHAQAQNNLGLLYVRGNGVPQDYDVAVKWFAQAAEAGNAKAMTNLGVMYENGFGVAQSDERAAELYRAAGQNADQGLADQLAAIGFLPDPRLRVPAYEPASLIALQKTAQAGDPVAQFLLAYLLVVGPDATSTHSQAAYWFTQASYAGVPMARANLGLMYFQGLGVPQDFVSGYMWLSLAAVGGDTDLRALRDIFTPKMTAEQVDDAQELAQNIWQAGKSTSKQ